MRREERAAAVRLVQMLDRRPGDGETIEGRGAAPDLVENNERALRRLVQDGGGLDHLDHEGRAAAPAVVGGSDAADPAVADARKRGPGRAVAAGLRRAGD